MSFIRVKGKNEKRRTDLKLLKESIAHWKRMIKWAKKRDPMESCYAQEMLRSIEEDWFSDFCPLCKKYSGFCDNFCSGCPLDIFFITCEGAKSKWMELRNRSEIWMEWIYYAKRVKRQLVVTRVLVWFLECFLEWHESKLE